MEADEYVSDEFKIYMEQFTKEFINDFLETRNITVEKNSYFIVIDKFSFAEFYINKTHKIDFMIGFERTDPRLTVSEFVNIENEQLVFRQNYKNDFVGAKNYYVPKAIMDGLPRDLIVLNHRVFLPKSLIAIYLFKYLKQILDEKKKGVN
jgi:hypothetical protein